MREERVVVIRPHRISWAPHMIINSISIMALLLALWVAYHG